MDIFQDDNIFKISDWSHIFTSNLFYAAVVLIVVGTVLLLVVVLGALLDWI